MDNKRSCQWEYDIEDLLEKGNTVQVYPQGYSMYPLWLPGRDSIIIGPIKEHIPARGEVILFRREDSLLIIHRVHHRDNLGFYFVGDNQTVVEGPVPLSRCKGILLEIIRGGRHIPVDNPVYVVITRLWLWMRPLRPFFTGGAAAIKRRLGKGRREE